MQFTLATVMDFLAIPVLVVMLIRRIIGNGEELLSEFAQLLRELVLPRLVSLL